ncbi:MAG: hypothetical protein EXR79_02675 [Myxococcales bacterium]|nr:hypothetical protein [Myxococcales bacterium]
MSVQRDLSVGAAPLDAPLPDEPPLRLQELDLRDGLFAGADLADADLSHATLAAADLRGAVLRGARLRRADLTLALLEGADLRGADLSGADLSGADLRGARLDGADLAGAELAWTRLQGARGLAPDVLLQARRGNPAGSVDATGESEPIAGVQAFRRGQAAHAAGQLGVAERHLKLALRWVPDSGAAWWALGAVQLDRGEPERAARCWRAALAGEPDADRARVDLAVLALATGDLAGARHDLATLTDRHPDAPWLALACAALANEDAAACVAALQVRVGDSPAVRWFRAAPQRSVVRPAPVERVRFDDPAWDAAERADLEAVLQQRRQTDWVWHGAIGRALQIGALDLAFRAEQRLQAIAPDQRLWGLELKHLDVTAHAFEALVYTRVGGLGAVQSVRWVALGAHGPTARIESATVGDGGRHVTWGKRWHGASRPPASVAYTHRAAQCVQALGLPTGLPLHDAAGADALPFAGDLLCLYTDLGGVPVAEHDLDVGLAERIGAWLGRMHRGTAHLALGPRPRAGLRTGTRTLRAADPAAAWRQALAADPVSLALFDRHPLGPRLLPLLQATARRLRGVLPGCVPGLVHGDLGPGNIIRLDGDARSGAAGGLGGLGVVDWDLCDLDVVVFDLARCLDLWTVRWPAEAGLPVEVRDAAFCGLVRGYASERPLLRAERAALPVLVAASRVDLDATVLPMCAGLEPEVADPVLARQLTRLSRAAAGAPELAERLREALDGAAGVAVLRSGD